MTTTTDVLWEKISQDDKDEWTERLAVPGGWLYWRMVVFHGDATTTHTATMVFVPTPAISYVEKMP